MRDRARGCLLGQLAGDSLGSQVEFLDPVTLRERFPDGLRRHFDSPVWRTLAGQPTDDSEMALMLARSLVQEGTFQAHAVFNAYVSWLKSVPFDVGRTVGMGLSGAPNPQSQANGALMRISPLGIFGARYPRETVAGWAAEDAKLTHPHPVCLQTSALFATAIAHAVGTGCDGPTLFAWIGEQAAAMSADVSILEVIEAAGTAPPADFMHLQGWVLIAFQNALYHLRHSGPEDAIVTTIMGGGDTDTNAAICGALVGAVHGLSTFPEPWVKAVLSCRPEAGLPGVLRPRPAVFWPVDALELADGLLGAGGGNQTT
ncbi:MAG: ribosylglycohydrolase [Deltaproteobacteria bacterium HGW-Deltaproteobacteria-17]|nr:MAG: ribosylglycohydrolase [Deltaproteobacteria bacterium HGW-Deltaproteobacteria-17]